MWAICRYHHGLTWKEFQSLTLAQFEALEDRRMVDTRQARFNAALITTTIYNANRSKDSDPLEVWDFIPGYERDQDEMDREKARQSIQQGIRVALTGMRGKTVEQVREAAKAMISNLQRNGTEDADDIVREAFEEVIQAPLE